MAVESLRELVARLSLSASSLAVLGLALDERRKGTRLDPALKAEVDRVIAALGATAYSRALGQRVSQQTEVPAESGTEPTTGTPRQVANAQRQLEVLQWVVPALTGALVVVSSHAGEQQRPENVLEGLLARARG